MKNTTDTAYSTLLKYVKRTTKSTFDSNTIRQKLSTVKGLKPSQMGSIVNRAVRNGMITKVSETTSTVPGHRSGRVGVYTRGTNL